MHTKHGLNKNNFTLKKKLGNSNEPLKNVFIFCTDNLQKNICVANKDNFTLPTLS